MSKNELTQTVTGRDYRSGRPCTVSIAGSRIIAIKQPPPGDATALPWIAPGLVDAQINGFAGEDFNRADSLTGSLVEADRFLAAQGCTHYLITLITHPRSDYPRLFNHWNGLLANAEVGALGYHLEGPFLNPDSGYRGVHEAKSMQQPSIGALDELMAWSNRQIRVLTMAPETDWPNSLQVIRAARERGIQVSAGHSSLMGPALESCVEAGLSSWTHLGNAAPALMPKFENVLWHVLASSIPNVFLIPDGIHLPPHVFRALSRGLGDRLRLTTDAMSGAGSSPGQYSLGAQAVQVHGDGRATVPGSTKLAGSTLSPFAGVFRAAEMTGRSWATCWDAFSTAPGQWLGLEHQLTVGQEASFCLFDVDPSPTLRETWRKGRRIHPS